MRSLLLGLVVLAVGCAESPPPPVATPSAQASPVAVKTLTIQEFRARVVERVQTKHPDWKFETKPDKVIVTIDGRPLELVAERSYAMYEKSPEKLEGLLADQLAGMEEYAGGKNVDLEKWSVVAPYLMPSLGRKSETPEIYMTIPFQGDLVQLFYYDHPDSRVRSRLTWALGDSWKVSPSDKIRQTALKNLASREPVTVEHDTSKGVTVYHIEPADDYGAARILLPDVRLKMVRAAGDDLVVGLPSRDLAWAVAASDANAVKAFTLANQKSFEDATEPITPQLFRMDNKTGAMAPFQPAKLLTQEQFQKKLVERVRARHPDWKISVKPGEAPVIEMSGGRAMQVKAERGYESYRSALSDLEGSLDQVIAGLEETMSAPDLEAGMASFDKARPYLLPGIIRGNPSDGSAFKPLSGDLVVVYFYDHPQSTQRVLLDEKHVKGWKCTVDQIDKAARENLAKRYPIAPKEIAPGVFRLSDADDFGAARILDASGLKKLADRQKSDLLVWAPSRMLAWACSADDPKGVKALSDLAVKSTLEDPEPISPNPLRYNRATGTLAP